MFAKKENKAQPWLTKELLAILEDAQEDGVSIVVSSPNKKEKNDTTKVICRLWNCFFLLGTVSWSWNCFRCAHSLTISVLLLSLFSYPRFNPPQTTDLC